MLNLPIAMKRALLIIPLLLFYLPVHAQAETGIVISSPNSGDFIQGLVVVEGTITVLGFSSYELSFAYDQNPTETWFVLQSSTTPVIEGELGIWDTTTLTDGNYNLRVRVFLLDGSLQETTLSDLRVRNYTAIPTATPAPPATIVAQFAPPTAQLIVPKLATVTPSHPTPTPFQANPVGLELLSISAAIRRGALLVLLFFIGFGLILRFRRD